MTREERNNKLKYLITCMKCEMSGKCRDEENCPTQYNAGNVGEIIENLEEISKILEQEPCKDAISREAVKELFQEGSVMGMYHFLGIDELPSVTPKKDGWTPCNVRLPKQNEYIGNVCKYYLVQDCYGDMYVARYTKKGWNPIESLFFLDDIVAWRPLPKRYENEGDNNDK